MEPCCNSTGKTRLMKGDQVFRVVERNCYSLEERIKDMDATGITIISVFVNLK